MYSDTDILSAINHGQLGVEPFNWSQLQPASVDLTLAASGRTFVTRSSDRIRPWDPPGENAYREIDLSNETVLYPGEFLLGCTEEVVTVGRKLAARFEGKSSLGRIGLSVHVTAGFIDPGFSGQITLEITNVGTRPIILRSGMPIGQLCVFELKTEAMGLYGDERYGSKYNDQRGATPARG